MGARRLVSWAVSALGAGAVLAVVTLTAYPSNRLTADIHSEYVKYTSGGDTITATWRTPSAAIPRPRSS